MTVLDVGFCNKVESMTSHASIACLETVKQSMIANGRMVIIDRYNGVVKGSDSLHSAFNSWSVANKPKIKISKSRYRNKPKRK